MADDMNGDMEPAPVVPRSELEELQLQSNQVTDEVSKNKMILIVGLPCIISRGCAPNTLLLLPIVRIQHK